METKINIAEILKDKPINTKLYDLVRNINVYLTDNPDSCNGVYCTFVKNGIQKLRYSSKGTLVGFENGMVVLAPSKEMHDWSKFAWKKGDLLVNSCGFQCIFKEWASNDYTKFNGCYSNSRDGYEDISNARTDKFDKLDNNVAYRYIREIERKLGGKLNLETLEIEKTQPEFKNGDILCVINNSNYYHYILIYKGQDNGHIYRYVTMFEDNFLYIRKDAHLAKPKEYSIRYATEEEKQRLFAALEKKNKAWDAEKKEIIDLKPKVEFKPFDKVLVRDCLDEIWRPSFFARYLPSGREPYQVIGGERVKLCIPYEGNESLLGTTKGVEG